MEDIEARNRLMPMALNIAVAVDGKKKSKSLVRWALEKFASKEHVVFELLHVRPRIIAIPTPTGGSSPISQVPEDVASIYKKEIEWRTREMLLPYKKMFTMKEVQADFLVMESDDVVQAIAEAVLKHRINKLIIGASSSGVFVRKLKKNSLSLRILNKIPCFCTVYVVSNGKLLSTRPSDMDTNESIRDDSSETNWSNDSRSASTSSTLTGSHHPLHSPSLPVQRLHASSSKKQTLFGARTSTINTKHNRCMSLDVEERKNAIGFYKTGSEYAMSPGSSGTDNHTLVSYQDSNSTGCTNSSTSGSQVNIDFELEKLKIELRHVRGMYAMAQMEIIDASRKLSNLNHRRLEEATKLKELKLKEEKAEEFATEEKEKHIAAKEEAEQVKECVEREASHRRVAEIRAKEEAKEKESLENCLVFPLEQYVKFTWEEIEAATSSFSEDFKIGMGAYGSVYKCKLHHTTVAVKVLNTDQSKLTKHFEQELEILSKIRHPHLLLLLGACPERRCLIYEYMENGSLEERLLLSNYTTPIPWFERYRIAWEVASAISFLHSTKPKPIVHRDLKPANILLDHNLVSKISDVGLSKVVNLEPSYTSTFCKETDPIGTFFYMDPEYQRTGMVSPQSDVYAFGVIILQLLTAKPAMGLAIMVEESIRDGKLGEILDKRAGPWPVDETRELAIMGLRCTELRRRDRPGFRSEVLPLLERLKGVAERARNSNSRVQVAPPTHFICPILKDIMKDPCVAADGYTYDRKGIEGWLRENNRSPITNLPLPNNNLLPNYALRSAIIDWKSNEG